MNAYRRNIVALFAVLLIFSSLSFAEDVKKPDAAELIAQLVKADVDTRWTIAHQLAECPNVDIAAALKNLPADAPPANMVALLSVLLPKEMVDDFDVYFRRVLYGPDAKAKAEVLDLISYAVPFTSAGKVFQALQLFSRDEDLDTVTQIRIIRAGWMLLMFIPGAAEMIAQEDKKYPRSIRDALLGFMTDKDPEDVRSEAAVTLGEMGIQEPSVVAIIRRVANDPTQVGSRARSVLLGHPIYDEVVRRAQLFHVDLSKLDYVRLSIEACKGLCAGLDKHSSFFDPDAVKSWSESRTGEYGGIGAYVAYQDNAFVITRPFYNGPAYKAGLRSGDKIIEVGGVEMVSKDVDDLVRVLKGPAGTKVKVMIFRKGWSKPREFEITRGQIDVPNIHTAKLPGNIAYVRLDSFSEKARDQMAGALKEVNEWKPDGLVFDLRGNPGGGLQTAVDIVSMFIEDSKMVVYEEGRPDLWPRQNHFSRKGTKYNWPLVVLVNEFSASASEIVSGSLKDYDRATLVGVKTYGKGSVQLVFWVNNSFLTCQVKLTIAKYYLPKGECIHDVGIDPHVKVEMPDVPGWVFDEAGRLREDGTLKAFMDKLMADKKLAYALADNDYGDPSRYPGFDEWAASIKTVLDRENLRLILSEELRKSVQDEKGKEFACAIGNDTQLQEGLLTVLRKSGKDPAALEDVAPFVLLESKRRALAEAEAARLDAIRGKNDKETPAPDPAK
ncbi:MAG: S41 family peptidase [Candidatus Brocadiia bacterium]